MATDRRLGILCLRSRHLRSRAWSVAPPPNSSARLLMLGRVLLAIDDARLRARVRRTISQADMLVENVENSDRVLAELARQSSDLFVVSRKLIPEPAAENVASYRGLPESPEVV